MAVVLFSTKRVTNMKQVIHTHTHTHIYIYIYIYKERESSFEKRSVF